MSGPPKWITEAQIRSVLTWDVLVPAMADVLADVTVPEANIQPLRSRLHDPTTNGTLLLMPGLSRGPAAFATKVLSMYPGNAQLGLHTHSALVLLMDPANGHMLALLEGKSITELRTAAASAAATLAIRGAKQATKPCEVVAVLGAGTQGAAHARVMNSVLKPRQVRIWSHYRTTDGNETEKAPSRRSQELAATLLAEGIPAVACCTVSECVAGAEVINTCTLATKPVLFLKDVMEGAHINSVGAASRTSQELESALTLSAEIFADSKEAAMAEAGDIVLSGAKVTKEIGELIRGVLPPPTGKITIFKSLGVAVEDAVAAKLVYDKLYPAK